MNALKSAARQHNADLLMSFIIVVWGFNFIVVKSGVEHLAPLTYNALRFALSAPVMLGVAWWDRSVLRISRRDLGIVAAAMLFGSVGYQILFGEALKRTTSTNTALLVATIPTWTAVFSIGLGMVAIRRRMVFGIVLTLSGAALVVLGRSGAQLSFSHQALIGSGMALVAAIIAALSGIINKPLVDRLGSMRVAVWGHWVTTAGLLALAGPSLAHLTAADLPKSIWPNIVYSGLLASGLGFPIGNYALKALGPTRSAAYHNITPIIAAGFGILLLSEPVTPGLMIGACLTLVGVVIVRQNTFIRPPAAPDKSSLPGSRPQSVPAAGK